MPLGYSGYWDFDLSGYEDALMELAGAQRSARQTTGPQAMARIGEMLRQFAAMRNQREQQEWMRGMKEREMGLSERRWDTMEDYYGAQMEQWGKPKPLSVKDAIIKKIYEQGSGGLNPGELELAYGLGVLDRPEGRGTGKPPAYVQSQNWIINTIFNALKRQDEATGVPRSDKQLRQMAEDIYVQRFGVAGETGGFQIGTPEFERLYQSALRLLPEYDRPNLTRERYMQSIGGGGMPVAVPGQTPSMPTATPTQTPTMPTTQIPPQYEAVFSGFENITDALADARINMAEGKITPAEYAKIMKWAQVYWSK